MPIDLNLTITGLCVIVLKSKEDYPEHPSAVEVLCVDAHRHRPVLGYSPKDMDSISKASYVEPELCVDPKGERLAVLGLSKRIVSFEFGNKPAEKFTMTWGDSRSIRPPEEEWMNWIAPVQYLGLKGVQVGENGDIPKGAAARVKLLPGSIKAQEIIKDPQRKVVVWKFPAVNGKTRALANQLVYSVAGAKYVSVLLDGKPVLTSTASTGILWMSLSNDMTVVPYDYNQGVTDLKHLKHLKELAKPPDDVVLPEVDGSQRTGKPICNQVIFVDQS